jgi:beta-galactosidase/beta-glucuronidase
MAALPRSVARPPTGQPTICRSGALGRQQHKAWTEETWVSEARVPRPEYPRPQFERSDWLNLNGEWEFEFDDADQGLAAGWWRETRRLSSRILVPFPFQSRLSGIGATGSHEVVWYAREFDLPPSYTGCEIWLHFGAVDYAAQVWLNGEPVGENRGGHVPFSFEVTGQLRPGRNRLTLRVEDSDDPRQPRGRQRWTDAPADGSHTPSSGIWQTVWLEPAAATHIARLRITPRIHQDAAQLELQIACAQRPGLKLRARALLQGREVAQGVVPVDSARVALELPLRQTALWTPEQPFLYDLELTLLCLGMAVDRVNSYFGMREVAMTGSHFRLNGQPFLPCLALDAGHFPEGLVTAPTDEALRYDVELAKALGFNGVRRHQQIADPRWLTWCDRLGLLVWSEMPHAPLWSAAAAEAVVEEWARAIERDYNHPCVAAWIPFPEQATRTTPRERQDFMEGMVALTSALDDTRPMATDAGAFRRTAGIDDLRTLADREPVMGFYHTQLADVEASQSGLLTADRQPKVAPESIAALLSALQRRYRDNDDRDDVPVSLPVSGDCEELSVRLPVVADEGKSASTLPTISERGAIPLGASSIRALAPASNAGLRPAGIPVPVRLATP